MRTLLVALLLLFPLLGGAQHLDAEHYLYRDAVGRELVLPRHPGLQTPTSRPQQPDRGSLTAARVPSHDA